MNKLLLLLAFGVTGISLFLPPIAAQTPSPAPAKRATRVPITEGPALESAREDSAIIKWTSKNPGGTDEHFGVVHYGTDPKNLSGAAKSHIRLNPSHSSTVFRVRVDGLTSKTTYYYTIDSVNARGASDGVVVGIKKFMTP
jgi:Purple acid Phosphatase, N-terminal domain